ncbi:hypothetical protein HY500_02865 [Candidatus Woesearchaeota archaeon]|nr:hypothetical protein [Candidatus Woesearchaeota archaeon]
MAETDYVISGIMIKKSGFIDLRETYALMKQWFFQRRYDFMEKEYSDRDFEDGKTVSIKWSSEKKVDDYAKMVMNITFSGNKLEDVKVGNRNLLKGNVSILFESYVYKDYEDNWEKNPATKFIREVFDKFIAKQHFDNIHKDLMAETYSLFDEVKRYLKAAKYD